MAADKHTDDNPQLSIVIPTYKERDNIVPLVTSLHKVLDGYNYEIVIVDDNSQDGTFDLVNTLSQNYPVKIFVRKDKRGLSSAVVDGFSFSSGKVIAVMDGDLQHPPEIIPDLLREIDRGVDLTIASRYVEGGSCENWVMVRSINSKGAIFLAHLLLPKTRRVRDPMSGFFMVRRDVVTNADLNPIGYKILLEILMVGHFDTVTEVPFTFRCRSKGESKLNSRQQIEYLKHLYRLMRRTGELMRFLKYCIVGASGVIVDEGIFWALTGLTSILALAAGAISAEAAIISNFTFNNYFTFSNRRLPGIKPFLARLLKFNMVSLIGIGVKLTVFWLLTTIFGAYDLLFNLCGIAVATAWNYTMNMWWTWK